MQKQCRSMLVALLFTVAMVAQAAESGTMRVEIPAQPIAAAINELSRQSGLHIVIDSRTARGVVSTKVEGELTAEAALAKLLENTGLGFEYLGENAVAVVRGKQPTAGLASREEVRMAQGEGASRGYDVPASDEASDSTQLQEIVVTATKRLENVQDIPMSIAVIGSQEIERRGLIGMEDYLRSIPGVSQIDQGPLNNAIVIRGITTSPQAENFFSGTTVATYFGETPITGAAGQGAGGIDVRPVDIERIEVLRGPQGTAYGSASLGGTLRIIPAKPKLDTFSARGSLSYADTSDNGSDNTIIQGVLNIPLVTDKLAVRAVGYRYDESGFYRNNADSNPALAATADFYGIGDYVRGFSQSDVGHMISTGGRLSALWQATDKLDLSLTYLTQKIEQDGAPIASTGRYEQAHAPIAPQARARGETGETSDTDIDLVNLVLNYDLGWGALTTTASQVDSGSLLTADLLSAGFFMPASSSGPSDFKSFTAETRVASKLAGRFQFLGGLFYENIDEDFTQTVDWPGPTGTNPLGLFGLPVTDPIFISTSARELQQRAVFGELSYDLTAKLTATAGARYFKYDKDERTLTEGGLARLLIGAGTPVVLNSDEDNSSLKANLRYRPTDDATVYASWSEGFRLGHPAVGLATCDLDGDGVVDNSNISVASTQQVDSDALDNYEIGGKLALFGHRMLVDAAAYHIDWQGLPIAATVQGCSFGYTANAGSATSDGVELQASLQVVDGLRLDFGGAYTKAELSETSSLGEDGARLPGSPKVNANLAAEYNFKMAGHTAFVRADSLYVGKFYGDLAQTPATLAGDYIKVNAAAGVAIQNLSIELFVRNLTNEDAFTWRSSNITGNALNGYRLRPRTIGIQLAYSFE